MVDTNLQFEINKAFECKNLEFLKDKLSYALHKRILELVDYIGKKVINELSEQERKSFFSDMRCGIARGSEAYRHNVLLGCCLIKLNLEIED